MDPVGQVLRVQHAGAADDGEPFVALVPRRFGVSSASGRSTGVMTTSGAAGCASRTTSRNAVVLATIWSKLCGIRVQQLVP
jgi:hypothetical protein